MKTNITLLASMVLLTSLPTAVYSEAPAGVVSDVIETSATVEKVDKRDRMLTLRSDSGEEFRVRVGPQVRNFDRIDPGDKVRARFSESIALAVLPKGSAPEESLELDEARAQLGQKPAGSVTETLTLSATIQDIDKKNRTMTLREPQGQLHKVRVPERVENFDQLRSGQELRARITESVAISVEE